MELTNCQECGKAFAYNKVGPRKCSSCKEKDEEKFKKVKDFLWEHPNTSIEEVHEATGVEKEIIMSYVREGRLVAEGLEIDLEYNCERCGVIIEDGRFCKDCQDELVKGLGNSEQRRKANDEKPESVTKDMFLKDRIKRRKGKGK